MIGVSIVDTEYVVRFCRKSTLDDEGSITFGAFLLRRDAAGNALEDYLSVNCLTKLPGKDMDEQIQVLRTVHPMKLGKRDKFAVLNVGTARLKIHSEGSSRRWIRVLAVPLENNPSHAGIYDTGGQDEVEIAHLLTEAILRSVPAAEV